MRRVKANPEVILGSCIASLMGQLCSNTVLAVLRSIVLVDVEGGLMRLVSPRTLGSSSTFWGQQRRLLGEVENDAGAHAPELSPDLDPVLLRANAPSLFKLSFFLVRITR